MTPFVNALPIMVIDDEPNILFATSVILKNNFPNQILTLESGEQVLEVLGQQEFAAVILDLLLPGVTGHELLPRILSEYPHLPVLIMTGSNTIDTAVECMKQGAFDYLVKPVEKSRLVGGITRALEIRRLRGEVSSLKRKLLEGELLQPEIFEPIVTRNRKVLANLSYLESVAESDLPLLITGETGTGKELFAEAAHSASKREGKYVAVNIAGLDDLMLSDTLFGHRKGAFTGADQGRDGLLAEAASGTLLLDEIGDLSMQSQTKLLRLIQTNEYYPLGSDTAKKTNARIIATTNHDLQALMEAGTFRKDLFFRLSTHSCTIPPLRERSEDIPLLFDHFVSQASARFNKKKPLYHDGIVKGIANYDFPGNVRELQAMIYDAVARQKSGPLPIASFQKAISMHKVANDGSDNSLLSIEAKSRDMLSGFPTLAEAEELLIQRAMERANGNQREAASLLGITRQALNNRLIRKRRDHTE